MTESDRQADQLSFKDELAKTTMAPPIAICTLADDDLRDRLQTEPALQGVLVGGLNTENIGIEQIITYLISTPGTRYLILCGVDGKAAIGHLPGQSFLALGQNGLEEETGRIIGAQGKRPVIQNVSREAVEHFRKTVTLVDLIGNSRVDEVLAAVAECIENYPGPAEPFYETNMVPVITEDAPVAFHADPKGYFVIMVDFSADVIKLEHFSNSGIKDLVIQGKRPGELYYPAIERGLVSRLDHAAYLGRELARAEKALLAGVPFVQDEG